MGQDEARKMKLKALSSKLGNSVTIDIKTPHTNLIIFCTEGLHSSKSKPIPVLSNLGIA